MLPEKSRDSISLAPIASPHGGGLPPEAPSSPEIPGPHVRVRCPLKSALFGSFVAFFHPVGLLTEVVRTLVVVGVASLFGANLWTAAPFLFVLVALCSIVEECFHFRSSVLQLAPEGVWRRRTYSNTLLRWRQILWVCDWGGHVWLATFSTCCFVSRESFASREQSGEFVGIVRELRRTKGAAWPTIWGELSSPDDSLNLGKPE